jgi:hypothetical protein
LNYAELAELSLLFGLVCGKAVNLEKVKHTGTSIDVNEDIDVLYF